MGEQGQSLGETTFVFVTCRICEDETAFEVKSEDFKKWRKERWQVQDAFPYLNSDQRELLLSATCSSCWEKLYAEV